MMRSSKDRFWVLLFAGVMILSFSAFSSAAPVGIDWGSSTATNWNLHSATTLNNLVDLDGNVTSLSITITDSMSGVYEDGVHPLDPSIPFPSEVAKDSFWGASSDPSGQFVVSGLNPSIPYRITIFAMRTGVSDNREVQYDVSGANSDTMYLNAANNTDKVAESGAITPTTAGEITIDVSAGPNNTNGSGFFYIGGMIIEEFTESYKAYAPYPYDDAGDVPVDVQFSWSAPTDVVNPSYVVNVGTDPNANSTSTSVAVESYDPGVLSNEVTYYWRVDVVDPNTDPNTGIDHPYTIEGDVWNFTTIGAFPIFATQPENQLVKAGATATFTVTLLDDAGATYQWYHGDGTVVSGATSNILEITMVSAADEDDYYCVATNSAGTATSDSATLELEKLICHWPLDGDLVDIVGGKNGTFAAGGDPNYVAGLNGGALELTGAVNGWVDVGSIGISGNVPRTITGWVQATRSAQPQFAGVFGLTGTSWSSGTVFALDIYPANTYILHTIGWTETVGAVTTGDWGFFALTYDGSEVVAYYNGENIGSATLDLATVDNFSMGHMNSQSSAAVFAGLYDDIKVYNYARTDMEIAEDYLTVAGGYICAGTASPYDFNGDCVVNLDDLVYLMSDWLSCNRIPESTCFE